MPTIDTSSSRSTSGAVFLDRDGTLIRDVGYLQDPSQIQFLPGVLEALRLLQQTGLHLVLVSNQSGIARGYFTPQTLQAVQNHLEALLRKAGIQLSGWYYCPHHPEAALREYRQNCFCRKPAPGMLFRAARDFHLDLKRSYLVGDKLSDIQAGQAAGVFSILVRTGYGEPELARSHEAGVVPDAVAEDLLAAARMIAAHLQ